MTYPLVSVVIPTHDRYELAKNAIENVRQQTYPRLQIIVVEDGSRSGIADYIYGLLDPRVRYFQHRSQEGLAAARNTGTRIADGDYVAFLDDDDRWLEDKIELQVSILEKYPDNNCMVYCWTTSEANHRTIANSGPVVRGLMADHFFRGFTLPSSCMIIPRKALVSMGGHSDDLRSCVDHDLWMKLAQARFYMDLVPRGLVYCPRHDHSKMIKRLDDRLKGMRQFFQKWKPSVVRDSGIDSWKAIERVYHVQTTSTIIDQYQKNIITKQQALHYLRQLFSLHNVRLTWLDRVAFQFDRMTYTPLTENKYRLLRKIVSYPLRLLWITSILIIGDCTKYFV